MIQILTKKYKELPKHTRLLRQTSYFFPQDLDHFLSFPPHCHCHNISNYVLHFIVEMTMVKNELLMLIS